MDYLEYGVLDSYETVKGMLTVDLINRDQNKEFLKGIPRHDMEDLSLIYRIRINGDDNELMADILFTNKMLERYGITPEQLHHDALETAGRKEPLCILNVKEIMERMSDMLGMPALLEIPEQEAEYGFSLYMATNMSGRKGASVIAYPEFMDKASEKLNGDFYIFPSSVNEVMMLPDDGEQNWRNLENVVRGINKDSIPSGEKLSDKVYHYDSRERVFELAEKYESRKQERTEPGHSVLGDLKAFSEKAEKADQSRQKPKSRPVSSQDVSL
ncbi:MAG: DUF5688 family protein [Clostridiales bacterium]|nr:DUF5688 family protein [Clostridiales bacterium]